MKNEIYELLATSRRDEKLSVNQLGFWSALLTSVLAAVFFSLGVLTPARSGPFCTGSCLTYPYTSGLDKFIPSDYIWLYPGFLLAPTFVVLIASIHHGAAECKKVFSSISLSFALIYATIICIDYFIQFVVIEPSLSAGETSYLSLFTQYNPHGVFIALEGLGYAMMSISLLFAALALGRGEGRVELPVSLLFGASFLLTVLSFILLSLFGYDITAFEVFALLINWVVLINSGALLCTIFRKRTKRARASI